MHIHIPKTGGQSLAQRIALELPPDASWFDQGDLTGENCAQILDSAIERGQSFLSAHVAGAIFADEQRFDFLTLIRDPVEQIVSNLAHVSREQCNVLFPLTQKFPPIALLQAVPGWFFNVQAHHLLSAFVPRHGQDLLMPDEQWMLAKLAMVCDRLRWLATTEALDEFSRYFFAEVGIAHPAATISRNKAPDTGSDRWTEVRQWLRENARLYAVDSILYNEAVRRFADHKTQFWRCAAGQGKRFSDHARNAWTVFSGAEGQVILRDGWILRQNSEKWGIEHFAGPNVRSRLSIFNFAGGRLTFRILFFAGMEPDELLFLDGKSGDELPAEVHPVDDAVLVSIRLPRAQADLDIIILAPRIFPLCLFNQDWDESRTPIAYAATGWALHR